MFKFKYSLLLFTSLSFVFAVGDKPRYEKWISPEGQEGYYDNNMEGYAIKKGENSYAGRGLFEDEEGNLSLQQLTPDQAEKQFNYLKEMFDVQEETK